MVLISIITGLSWNDREEWGKKKRLEKRMHCDSKKVSPIFWAPGMIQSFSKRRRDTLYQKSMIGNLFRSEL